ncbi:ribosomal-processing cysteine protease Prp [Hungatella hathewayi]|nr:ribosomal-processing cysteine protease Prp [Hungatella hathewayi]
MDESIWLDVCGHAGYAGKGKDIVCAAVSTLFFSTINGINDYTDAQADVFEKRYMDKSDGDVANIKNMDEKSKMLLKSMLSGIVDLKEQYPDNITIEEGVEDFIKT